MSCHLELVSADWAVFSGDGRISVRDPESGVRAVGSGYPKVEKLPCGALLAIAGTLRFDECVRVFARQAGPLATFDQLCDLLPRVARLAADPTWYIPNVQAEGYVLCGPAKRENVTQLHVVICDASNDFAVQDEALKPGRYTFIPAVPLGYSEKVKERFQEWAHSTLKLDGGITPERAVNLMRGIMHEIALQVPEKVSDEFFVEIIDNRPFAPSAPVPGQPRIEPSLDGAVALTVPPAPLSLLGFQDGDPTTRPFVLADIYHSSAVREPATVARTGDTSSASFVTVAQFDIELSPLQSSYSAKNLTVSIAGGTRPSKSTGAGTASSEAGPGVLWSNPSNALGSDDAYATSALPAGGSTDPLRIDFDFSSDPIPGGAVLKGFELTIERSKTGSGGIQDQAVRLQESGTATGDNKASASVWPTSDGNAVYGGQGDLWNSSGITVADLNNGIVGCLIEAVEASGTLSSTARVDAVTFKVFFDEFVAEARVKIGAQLSSVLTVTGPTTSAGPEDRDVTGLTPGSTVTVEVQGRMVTGSGTVTAAIDQKRMTLQHRDHFAT